MKQNSLEVRYRDTCIKLNTWAKWARGSTYGSLGYPSMSHEQSAREGGGIDTRGSGLRVLEQPEGVDKTEKVLLSLLKEDPMQYKIVWLYFLRNWSIDKIRGDMRREGGVRLGYGNARALLREAVAWIDGNLVNQ